MRSVHIMVLFAALAAVAVSQTTPPLQCTANAGVPPIVRSEGLTELTGDLVVTCTGGTPTPAGAPVATRDFQVILNVNATNRILADPSFVDALLLIDEPAPANQRVCGTPGDITAAPGICVVTGTGTGQGVYNGIAGRPNVYQGRGVGRNVIVWPGVPIDPAGANAPRVIRITNLRVNANAVGVSQTPIPSSVTAFISVAPFGSLPIDNPQQLVAFVQQGLITFGASPMVALNPSTPQNPGLLSDPSGPAVSQFKLSFGEGFQTAFKTRTVAVSSNPDVSPPPVSQNILGFSYPTETGFHNPAFPAISGQGNLGAAGLSDSGTRLGIQFTNVPSGVFLFAPAVVPLVVVNLQGNPTGTGALRLINSTSGAGAFVPAGHALGRAAIPITGGVGQVFYEVMRSSPNVNERVQVPFYISYTTASAGTANVKVDFAPLSNVDGFSLTAPVPRFASSSSPRAAFSIGWPSVSAQTSLISVNEGSAATNNGTFTDPDVGNTVAITASIGSISQTRGNSGTWTWSYTPVDGVPPWLSAPQHVTITAKNSKGATGTITFELIVVNVPPKATFNAPASVPQGSQFALSLTSPVEPSATDTAAGLSYQFDCGSGYGMIRPTNSVTCPAAGPGTVTVRGRIFDKDMGFSEYSRVIDVTPRLPAVPGDVNGDGAVNCADVSIVRAAFGKKLGETGFDARADVVKDNVIDVRDLAYVSQRLPVGTRCP
jgi:hypothetical protein